MSTEDENKDTRAAQDKRAQLQKLLQEKAAATTYPQSFGQQRLWFVDQLSPGKTGYNTTRIIRLSGAPDIAVLERAFNEIIRRHDVCRTRFSKKDGEPVQQIQAKLDLKLNVVTIDGFEPDKQQAELERIALEKTLEVLDLEHGPLLKATLLKLAADEHVLILVMHHIITDGWSSGVINRELSALYNAYLKGEPSPLQKLPLQYTDFAQWQRKLVKGENGQQQLDYWRNKLAGAPPMLELSTDFRRPAVQSLTGGLIQKQLASDLVKKLNSLAKRHNSSLFMMLLTAFYVLLWRYTGQKDIVIGSPVAGRNRSEFEDMIGLFINVLPMRAELDGEISFISMLRRVREVSLETLANQDLPFDALVSELSPERTHDHHPIFQVMFTVQQPQLRNLDLQGLSCSSISLDTKPLAYDLTLVALEENGEITIEISYNKDLFEKSSIERMSGHYQQLLLEIAADPERRICDLQMFDAAEYRQIVEQWNQTQTEYPRAAAIHTLFERQAEKTPAAVAAEYGETKISYTELNQRANRLAHHLATLAAGPGALVGLCIERSIDMVVAMLAILKSGAAYVPLDPDYPQERLAFMIEDSAAHVIITHSSLVQSLPECSAKIFCLDTDAGLLTKSSVSNPVNQSAAQDLAYVIYTSGSTGTPKGVAVEHRGVVRLVCNTDYIELQASDRVVQASVCSFDAATFEIWGPLLNGACLVGVSREISLNPKGFAQFLREQKISVMFLTTALFNQMARETADAFASLRYVLFGGQAVSPAWVRAVLAKGPPQHLLHVYGPTETTTFATSFEVTSLAEDAVTVPIGRPIANSTAYVLDGYRRPVPVGVAGELYLGGDGVAREYLQRPELTANAFVTNPFSSKPGERLYRTGDWVRYLADGNIEFIGRRDLQVKIRGFRIELGEIEAALVRLAAVQDSALLVREDESGDQRLVAYVVAGANKKLKRETLQQELREHLPEYMIPSMFVQMDALPLNANGKVDKKALPEPAAAATVLSAVTAVPRNSLEKKIAGIFREVLHLEEIGINDNFFDLGGHSLLLVKLHSRLSEECGSDLSIIDLFEYPTVEALARRLAGDETQHSDAFAQVRARAERQRSRSGAFQPIAIVGMSGRFPSAANPDALWQKLCEGFEPVEEYSVEELLAEGVSQELLDDPDYVRAGMVLDDVGMWDAPFFGFTPREAQVLDPQQRLFLECAWEALENAGCDPERYAGAIGVFAGIGINRYQKLIDNDPVLSENFSDLENLISSDKDFVATRAAYKFNLTGPALTVQSACSTSLVAVHMAVRSLQAYESDMALAGGVSIKLPQKTGYLYVPQGIASPDCHCRAFDARAQGTMRGNGACIVVLKRLDDAIADGDSIHAVIRGSAINNDGAAKVGYTAPGTEGQAQVIAAAQAEADIDPATIGYVETHGTGTPLGDPVEVAALTQAFRARTDAVGYCGIGSIKTNIGHLDAAAGCTGFLKAAMAVEHGRIPASLHFAQPNPEIDFASSPFYVVDKLTDWPAAATPRRAAVSSFGVGGTNAHVIIEQAPDPVATSASRDWQLLPVSARTASALDKSIQRLEKHISNNSEQSIADIAWTLQNGRREFEHRACIIVRDRIAAIEKLAELSRHIHGKGHVKQRDRQCVFMFSGQGSQYPNMGLGLYQSEKVYRDAIDQACELLRNKAGIDLKSILYPSDIEKENSDKLLRNTAFAQPALFATEYALARLWMSWGIQPEAMVGHSIGEYVAACIAGVMSFDAALLLVAERGRMISELPGGTMLAVPLAESALLPMLNDNLSLAAVNAPQLCVVSGETAAMAEFAETLKQQDIEPIELHTSHAFHSRMMEPVLKAFAEKVARIELKPAAIPYMSNVSGTWITDAEATDPQYWAQHLRQGVRFSAAIATLLEDDSRMFIEIGPGKTLSSLVRQQLQPGEGARVFGSIHHPREQADDNAYLLEMLGGLWLAGASINWADFSAGEKRRRVALPTYPFERQMHWVSGQARSSKAGAQQKKSSLADWFYTPEWSRSVLPPSKPERTGSRHTLVFCDQRGLGDCLIEQLRAQGDEVVKVFAADAFAANSADSYNIDPAAANDYRALLAALDKSGKTPESIVHMFVLDELTADEAEQKGFYSLLYLAQALGTESDNIVISVISEGVHAIQGTEKLCPEKALVQGMCRVLPDEYTNLSVRHIDVVVNDSALTVLARQLISELGHEIREPMLAYRSGQRLKQVFQPLLLAAPASEPERLRQAGVYLITGGLGGIGLALADYLADSVQAKLVLTGRGEFPPVQNWSDWLSAHDENDAVSGKIRKLQSMQSKGAELMIVSADVADENAMRRVIEQAVEKFGAIHGVIHSAGVGGGGVIQLRNKDDAASALAPKVAGTRLLNKLLEASQLDFIVLCSSLSSILGGASRSDYCAANAYQDAFAFWSQSQSAIPTISINWDSWRDVGMAFEVELPPELAARRDRALRTGISNSEGVEVFRRILSATPLIPQVLVSTFELASRLPVHTAMSAQSDDFVTLNDSDQETVASADQRAALSTSYAPANTSTEKSLAKLWHELLGIDQLGINDNFFELGGHSLLALRVIGRTSKLFDIELALQDLFDNPTVAELAVHIDSLCGAAQADHDMVAALLDSVESLSDDDLEALLAQAEAHSGEQRNSENE